MAHISPERNYDQEREYFFRVWGPSGDKTEIPAAMSISDSELMKQTIHEGIIGLHKRIVVSHIELVERVTGNVVGHRWLSNNITIDAKETLEVWWQLDISLIGKKIKVGM
jgi:hypothetical protein